MSALKPYTVHTPSGVTTTLLLTDRDAKLRGFTAPDEAVPAETKPARRKRAPKPANKQAPAPADKAPLADETAPAAGAEGFTAFENSTD